MIIIIILFLTSVSAGGNTASMTYDAVGNLISLSQSVFGNTVSNVYSYSHDKISSITHNGFSYTFEYDAWGNRTTVRVAGSVLEETEYDTGSDHDRITGINYANGQSVEYTYNSDGNLTGVNYDNSANDRYTYTYDTDGNLTQIADNLAGTKTVYTESGTEIRKISDNTLLYSSILNDDGENELSLGSSDIVFTYDSEYNSVTGITTDSTEYTGETTITDEDNNEIDCSVSAATAVNTDWFGRVVSKSVTTDVYATDGENILDQTVSSSTAVTYNDTATTASTQVSSYLTTVDGVTETEYYEYDSTGNISVIYHYTENGVRENLNRYFYDEAGQLTREDNRLGNFTTVYAYDVGGNVTSVTKYAYTENSDLSDLTPTETKTFTYRTSGWKDVLTAVNSDAVTTDSLGNVTSIANGQSYEWTAGRQLKKLTEADGDCYNYYYNADGYLSRFDVFNEEDEPQATYSYYWDGDKLSAVTIDNEDDNDYTTRIIYDSEGEATGFIVNDRATYLYRKNYLGDVIAIYDDSGDEVIRYYYDAFGNPGAIAPEFENPSDAFGYLFIAAFMTAINPILYRGYIWTPIAGYSYYLGSRFYVPSLYRFMNADVYEDTGTGVVGTNMFAYCDNNPVEYVDPNGLWAYDVHSGYKNPQKLKYNNSVQYYGTYYWARLNGYPDIAAWMIAESDNLVDKEYSAVTTNNLAQQAWHFNINGSSGFDSRDILADVCILSCLDLLEEANNAYNNQDIDTARLKLSYAYQFLGMSLHPIQDKYSHTNEVTIYRKIGSKQFYEHKTYDLLHLTSKADSAKAHRNIIFGVVKEKTEEKLLMVLHLYNSLIQSCTPKMSFKDCFPKSYNKVNGYYYVRMRISL